MPAGERILDFATDDARLSISLERLVIRRDGKDDVLVPLNEIAVTVVCGPRVSCSGAALAGLMRHGASLVICDDANTPTGLMLPLGVNNEQTKRILAQAAATRPTGKRLWKQVVTEKILSQAATLRAHRDTDGALPELARLVRSGDPANTEGRASRVYWPLLFNNPAFRRRRDAPDQNRLLNYGYAVLRAAMGRMICASGLHPSLGIHHHARNNPWVLADDLMEPYRPLVDDAVCHVVGELGTDAPLNPPTKARLIEVLHARLDHDGQQRTVLDWMARTAASLAQVYLGETDALLFPRGLRDACPGA